MNGLTIYQYTEFGAYKWESDVLNNYNWTGYADTQLAEAHYYYKLPVNMNPKQNLFYKTHVAPYTNYLSWGIPIRFPRF